MLRWFNRTVASLMPLMPKSLVGHFSRHYIAGDSLDDAVRVTRELMEEGCCVTIDVLGEGVEYAATASSYAQLYLEVLDRIAREKLDANVSVKPTQMGLSVSSEICRRNYALILERARQHGNFTRIDMEDSPWYLPTLDLHDQLRKDFDPHVGVVIQSYTRRLESDARTRFVPGHYHLRLCKGIYKEGPEFAFQGFQEVRDNYLKVLRILLEGGCYVGIATHDEYLVKGAYRIIEELALRRDQYEFQMLLGVLPDLRRSIIARGHRLRVYVPFGEAWFQYSTRRLKENPDLVQDYIKGMFRKHK